MRSETSDLHAVIEVASPSASRPESANHSLFWASAGGIISAAMARRVAVLIVSVVLLAACAPERGRSVTLKADGQEYTLTTELLTVREVLSQAGITLDEDDRVDPVEPTIVEDGTVIEVVRVATQLETERRSIPFQRETVRDASIPSGESRLIEAGSAGIQELTYRTVSEDGVIVDRQLVRRVTVQQPRNEVVLIGARPSQNPTPISGTVVYLASHNAWVARDSTANHKRLTHTGDLDGRVLALSPRGSYLLYTRVVTSTPDDPALNSLWMIETAAADADPTALDAQDVLWADWDPSCNTDQPSSACRIAFTTGESTAGSPGWRAHNDLWVGSPSQVSGRWVRKRAIVESNAGGAYGWWGTSFSWSPGGGFVAYAQSDEVGIIDLNDGRRTVFLNQVPFRTLGPWAWVPVVNWAPSADYLVTTLHVTQGGSVAPEDSPRFDVWAISADGVISAELASQAGMWATPAYAPTGAGILFGQARSPLASQSSGYTLFLMDADGSNARPVFPSADELGLDYPEIAWGPAGREFLVVYRSFLYLVALDTGNVRQAADESHVTKVCWRW